MAGGRASGNRSHGKKSNQQQEEVAVVEQVAVGATIDTSLLQKTKLCRFFAAGKCNRRGGCMFAHGEEQLKQKPDFWRTQMCYSIISTGHCKYGSNCRYAHTPDELRQGAEQSPGITEDVLGAHDLSIAAYQDPSVFLHTLAVESEFGGFYTGLDGDLPQETMWWDGIQLPYKDSDSSKPSSTDEEDHASVSSSSSTTLEELHTRVQTMQPLWVPLPSDQENHSSPSSWRDPPSKLTRPFHLKKTDEDVEIQDFRRISAPCLDNLLAVLLANESGIAA